MVGESVKPAYIGQSVNEAKFSELFKVAFTTALQNALDANIQPYYSTQVRRLMDIAKCVAVGSIMVWAEDRRREAQVEWGIMNVTLAMASPTPEPANPFDNLVPSGIFHGNPQAAIGQNAAVNPGNWPVIFDNPNKYSLGQP